MEGKTRYYLIACGTSNYKNTGEYGLLPSVDTDLTRIVDLFTEKFGYKRVLINVGLNPQKETLITKFADWLQDEERCETDIVIFYYSGHGEYIQGDRHYLVMEDTDPQKLAQTSLPTEDLVRPLINEGVKISQILYIIDTCYSQSGAGNITEFASQVIQQFRPIKGPNISVHTIAACRAKDTAEEGVFSNALKEILENWSLTELNGGWIDLTKLVEKINKRISNKRVVSNHVGTEDTTKFLPILPRTWQTWEQKRLNLIEQLLSILNERPHDSLYFVNSFLLSGSFVKEFIGNLFEEFVLNDQTLRENLTDFAIKPVVKEICVLIACSEWCRHRFRDAEAQMSLANKIETWQEEVLKYRKGVDLNKIKKVVRDSYDEFKKLIGKKDLRIQIQISTEKDEENGTGLDTGAFLLNMNLWVEKKNLPLALYAVNKRLVLENNQYTESESDRLYICLKDVLPELIHKARYSLPTRVKLKIVFFLPFDYFNTSLDKITFNHGRNSKELGKEYPLFINSFERHFDKGFYTVRDEIDEKKDTLWKDNRNLTSEYYYIGTVPSSSDLENIEACFPIAVWSRNKEKPLVEGEDLTISEWKNWPHKIHDLRKQDTDRELTLFWDDLYPKPFKKLLDTKLVE
ncbi:MAG: caspase family protein [Stigonema ocellatum SAG 48.90 = DSM 106950]|nr:caspase family protein [Stigonema ocellatum SAG 48.90 = DSM 106950]